MAAAQSAHISPPCNSDLGRTCREPGCYRPIICKGYCHSHYRRLFKYGSPSGLPVKYCVECGGSFKVEAASQVVCSEECKKDRQAHLSKLAQSRSKARARERDTRPLIELVCPECQASHFTKLGNKKFCSEKCRRKVHRRNVSSRTDARIRSVTVESVNPIKVFERDGWKCQLCGKNTPRTKRGTLDKNAPELDHIMPLSRGGEHSYRNTQCSCRSCNAAKGNTPRGQLSLL